MPTPRCFSLVSYLLPLLCLCGCFGGGAKRPPLAQVTGTVTYKGQPVANATVTFIKDGAPRTSFGITDAEGKFTMTTYDTGDGAFLGTQKATVEKTAVSSGDGGKPAGEWTPADLAKHGPPKLKTGDTVPARYAEPETTPLQFTVEASDNTKNIELKD